MQWKVLKCTVSINTTKTIFIFFSKKPQPSNVPPLLLETHSLSKVNEHNDLGLLFTPPNLSWTKHIAAITANENRRFALSQRTLEIGYITFIRPILEYGDVIYDTCSIEDTTKLEKVQLEAATIVTGTKFLISSNERYLELGWLTLKIGDNLTNFQNCSPYLKTILDTITNYYSHAIRGHITSQLPIPKCKSEFFKKSVPI